MSRLGLLIQSCLAYCFYLITGRHDQKRQVLKTSVASLGGVYVKMMQFLMLRTEVFSTADKLEFLGFFDQVPAQKIDIESFLAAEIGTIATKTFTSIEPQPFAAGTFGQVYLATLQTGQKVIIKVKRQNLSAALAFDLFLIQVISWLASWVLDPKIVNLKRLAREFQEITWRELDYQQEVKNALALADFYRHHPTVVIPHTYAELSTKNLVVQEYIGGVSVTDLLRQTLTNGRQDQWLADTFQTDLSFINKSLSYSLLEQSFLLDRFYSDPHPGNIKILPNNQFAFIDFGIMADSPSNKRSYYQILKSMVATQDTIDTSSLSRAFFEFAGQSLLSALEVCDEFQLTKSAVTPKVIKQYEKQIMKNPQLLDKCRHTHRGDYAYIWQELLQLGEQFQMQLPAGMFAALRSAFLIKSFTSLLQPDVFVMKDVYHEITTSIDVHSLSEPTKQSSTLADPETALEVVADWLTNLIEHDALLYQRLIQI